MEAWVLADQLHHPEPSTEEDTDDLLTKITKNDDIFQIRNYSPNI
jgi:hypothetical protein